MIKEVKTEMSPLEQARAELNKERAVEAKEKLKVKLKEVARAERILANAKRELEELELEIEQGIE